MTQDTARRQGLEPVYPEGHEMAERMFYDPAAGKYYDAAKDLYVQDFYYNPLVGLFY